MRSKPPKQDKPLPKSRRNDEEEKEIPYSGSLCQILAARKISPDDACPVLFTQEYKNMLKERLLLDDFGGFPPERNDMIVKRPALDPPRESNGMSSKEQPPVKRQATDILREPTLVKEQSSVKQTLNGTSYVDKQPDPPHEPSLVKEQSSVKRPDPPQKAMEIEPDPIPCYMPPACEDVPKVVNKLPPIFDKVPLVVDKMPPVVDKAQPPIVNKIPPVIDKAQPIGDKVPLPTSEPLPEQEPVVPASPSVTKINIFANRKNPTKSPPRKDEHDRAKYEELEGEKKMLVNALLSKGNLKITRLNSGWVVEQINQK
jgi:hypothetical protein